MVLLLQSCLLHPSVIVCTIKRSVSICGDQHRHSCHACEFVLLRSGFARLNSFASPALCTLHWGFCCTVRIIDGNMQRVSLKRNTVCMCIHLLNQLLHYINKMWLSPCMFFLLFPFVSSFLGVATFWCSHLCSRFVSLYRLFKTMFQIEMTSGECSLMRLQQMLMWQCTGCRAYVIYSHMQPLCGYNIALLSR